MNTLETLAFDCKLKVLAYLGPQSFKSLAFTCTAWMEASLKIKAPLVQVLIRWHGAPNKTRIWFQADILHKGLRFHPVSFNKQSETTTTRTNICSCSKERKKIAVRKPYMVAAAEHFVELMRDYRVDEIFFQCFEDASLKEFTTAPIRTLDGNRIKASKMVISYQSDQASALFSKAIDAELKMPFQNIYYIIKQRDNVK